MTQTWFLPDVTTDNDHGDEHTGANDTRRRHHADTNSYTHAYLQLWLST